MSARPRSADTKVARLRAVMADGAWYAASALAEVGGTRFAARLFDIRRGTDGNTPLGKIDFVTVVLHEIGHGLGFTGSMDVDTAPGRGMRVSLSAPIHGGGQ